MFFCSAFLVNCLLVSKKKKKNIQKIQNTTPQNKIEIPKT